MENKRRRARRIRALSVAAATSALGLSVGASADAYPPTPPTTDGRSIDVSAFAPICMGDVPYIEYTIVPTGFVPNGPATLTFRDVNGKTVGQVAVDTLSGRVVYPGASIGADGSATDWPGWLFDGDNWVPDPTDDMLRRGLSIVVEVNPSATATVSYPGAESDCAGPEVASGAGGPGVASVRGTTTSLPQTGIDGLRTTLAIAAGVVGLGTAVAWLTRRRESGAAAPRR